MSTSRPSSQPRAPLRPGGAEAVPTAAWSPENPSGRALLSNIIGVPPEGPQSTARATADPRAGWAENAGQERGRASRAAQLAQRPRRAVRSALAGALDVVLAQAGHERSTGD